MIQNSNISALELATLDNATTTGLVPLSLIGLHHPLDGVTNPEYKLLCFIQLTTFFAKRRRH